MGTASWHRDLVAEKSCSLHSRQEAESKTGKGQGQNIPEDLPPLLLPTKAYLLKFPEPSKIDPLAGNQAFRI
jgi:hypothetical protein